MRIGGQTPQVHEEHHVDLIKEGWSKIRLMVKMMEFLPCMCFTKADCYRDAFNDFYIEAIIKGCDAENHQFDCDTYPPSPQKTQACADAATARNDETKLVKAFVNKLSECSRPK